MILDDLRNKGLISPPPFVVSNCMYLTVMGSHAYSVADTSVRDKIPDYDVYGFCIPPKYILFPHLDGKILDFHEIQRFDQYQKPHILDPEANGGKGKEWDFQIFNITKYFRLCANGNPNMLDSLATRTECVLHITNVGQLVRDNRKLFFSKKAWKTFRAYANSQLKKARNKIDCNEMKDALEFEKTHDLPHHMKLHQVVSEIWNRNDNAYYKINVLSNLTMDDLEHYKTILEKGYNKTVRFEDQKEFQQDRKFLYHIVRLYDEVDQLLMEGDMDLQRAKEIMKAVRRGEWTLEQVESWVQEKDKALEVAYSKSSLQDVPDEKELTNLLLKCLEEHYGSLKGCIEQPDWSITALREMDEAMNKYRSRIYE